MLKRFWWVGILLLATGCGLIPQRTAVVPTAVTPEASATPTDAVLAPTATATLTEPTATPLPSATPFPTAEPAPTLTPTPAYSYDIQLGSPRMLPDLKAAERNCQWMGVAGQVFDAEGQPVEGVVVGINGELGGKPVSGVGLSGLATDYGPGGYEILLAETPLASSGTLWAQVFSPEWEPLSPAYTFSTSADCAENLILLNFQGISTLRRVYLPVLSRGD
ncbi:MAG: hypothetical protein JW987_02515 [Anaerolineaceae bacterium]|nr:hypothetical protein [Anaerolineaceae bacterium]